MTMKRAALGVHKRIIAHRKRTSPAYAQLAEAPTEFREHFIASLPVRDRKYAAKRIEEEATNLALRRMANNELDPYPYIHEHEGCFVHGQRTNTQDAHDVFQPREGFVADENAYQE